MTANHVRFALADQIVHLDPDVKGPEFLEEDPYMNLESLIHNDEHNALADNNLHALRDVDVLRNFPRELKTDMDESQMAACESMLTKRVAIVQGPPGTGKTFISVSALRVLIENLRPGDPPIIVAAQTNHAVDQLLKHIMTFEQNVVRLGGRTDKENADIWKRTLFELRHANAMLPDGKRGLAACRREHTRRVDEIRNALDYLLQDKVIDSDTLVRYGLISQSQQDSLRDDEWSAQINADQDVRTCKSSKFVISTNL